MLRSEQLSLREEVSLNEELGVRISAKVNRRARPNECVKFSLHVEEIEKVSEVQAVSHSNLPKKIEKVKERQTPELQPAWLNTCSLCLFTTFSGVGFKHTLSFLDVFWVQQRILTNIYSKTTIRSIFSFQITSLLLGLSARLARTENSLQALAEKGKRAHAQTGGGDTDERVSGGNIF